MLGAFSIAAAGLQAQDSSQVQTRTPPVRDSTAEADPVPAMFAHPETDRWWIAGQANWISQRHPEVRSPYQGPRSLSPQAQDATSRVLTLFTGVRLTNTNELICVQETDDHGIGEAVGLAGVTNLDIVRNPDLSKAPYIARTTMRRTPRVHVCGDVRISRAALGSAICRSVDAESGQRHSPRCGLRTRSCRKY